MVGIFTEIVLEPPSNSIILLFIIYTHKVPVFNYYAIINWYSQFTSWFHKLRWIIVRIFTLTIAVYCNTWLLQPSTPTCIYSTMAHSLIYDGDLDKFIPKQFLIHYWNIPLLFHCIIISFFVSFVFHKWID